jgi:hypothetical protein
MFLSFSLCCWKRAWFGHCGYTCAERFSMMSCLFGVAGSSGYGKTQKRGGHSGGGYHPYNRWSPDSGKYHNLSCGQAFFFFFWCVIFFFLLFFFCFFYISCVLFLMYSMRFYVDICKMIRKALQITSMFWRRFRNWCPISYRVMDWLSLCGSCTPNVFCRLTFETLFQLSCCLVRCGHFATKSVALIVLMHHVFFVWVCNFACMI